MIESLIQLASRIKVDVIRFLAILGIVVALSCIDIFITLPASLAFLTSVFSSSSIILLVVAVSHFVRRALFPQIDLREFARSAKNDPIASAIVFMGVCVVLSVLIYTNVALLA